MPKDYGTPPTADAGCRAHPNRMATGRPSIVLHPFTVRSPLHGWMGAMITDPVIGSFVWVTSSLTFLAVSTAVVRMLDARAPALAAAPGTERETEQEPAP